MTELEKWAHRRSMAEQKSPQENRNAVITRWGGNPMLLHHGFTPVATAFIWYAAHLEPKGLSPAEVMFVLHLMAHKRDADAPYPSYQRLAQRMGVSQVYVRKIAQELERRGFLHREARVGGSNRFDLTPLFDRLAAHVATQRTLVQPVSDAEAEVNLL